MNVSDHKIFEDLGYNQTITMIFKGTVICRNKIWEKAIKSDIVAWSGQMVNTNLYVIRNVTMDFRESVLPYIGVLGGSW